MIVLDQASATNNTAALDLLYSAAAQLRSMAESISELLQRCELRQDTGC